MRPRVVIWGAGGHAGVVRDILRLRGELELVGYLDDAHPERRGQRIDGLPVLGGTEQLPELHEQGVDRLIVGFGACAARMAKAEQAKQAGFELVTAVHPAAILAADLRVGAGSVIKAGAILDVDVVLGESVLVGAGSTIAHGCRLEDGARTSGGANMAAESRLGRGAWLGVGATLRDRCRVGTGSLVGAGAVVVQDLPPRVVATGVPARVRRPARPGEV